MMNLTALVLISAAGAFAVIWLINYIPLISTIFGQTYSPRLKLCWLLAPFDAFITIFLICGTWVGLGTVVTGISTIIYNILTGIGISVGVVITKKYFVPKWQKEYDQKTGKQLNIAFIK